MCTPSTIHAPIRANTIWNATSGTSVLCQSSDGIDLIEPSFQTATFPFFAAALDPNNQFVPSSPESMESQGGTRVYRARFLMLAIFCLYSLSNAFQWIQYPIISNIIEYYYNVDELSVNWTSVVYMVTYIPLIFPASWLLDQKGLRFVVILGALGTCVGSWIKVFSVSPDRFVVCLTGQTVVAMSQVFILSIPPRLAAVWFSAGEVSRACAVGVFGNQFGIALGFLVPPQVVPDVKDKAAISDGLNHLVYGVAAFTTLLLITILIGFRDQPPTAPSQAQISRQESESVSYRSSLKDLLLNWNYVLLVITYGINVGTFYAVSTLLNQVVLSYYPGQGTTVGWMGLSLVVSGMFGSVVCGIVLDKTHRFKETTLVVYVLSLAGMVAYTFVVSVGSLWPTFAITSLLGFFMTGYLPLGFEFASELTYPVPEGTSSGILNASAQVFGITFTMAASAAKTAYGDRTANIGLSVAMLVGTILTALIQPDLRRRRAQLSEVTSSTVDT